ncbi:MAG: alkaline phosphatase family protein [Planctomycetes bacterium]|nr:alkaline phosphatase family protein [Planctomycetota bacterium]
MADHSVLLSIPALRARDLGHMPHLRSLAERGGQVPLIPSFPCVTCPVQANMVTGLPPRDHGVVANGFYWRDKEQVEMWTAWNHDAFQVPQLWDILHALQPKTTSAAWFPLNIKGAGADYICTPAPIHNPDGSESLWCYTKPEGLYGQLRDELGHFPLLHFWGPLANVKSSQWIAESAIRAARKFKPNFFCVYLPHLDYAAQKFGPDSPEQAQAIAELDRVIGGLIEAIEQAMPGVLWLAASEYVITPVRGVVYPNRLLRQAGFLQVRTEGNGELLDFSASRAFALVDHQCAHVFVGGQGSGGGSQGALRTPHSALVEEVVDLFRKTPGVAEVLVGDDRGRYQLGHPRSGEVILVADPDHWFAYYWWLDDSAAPPFARTVDIHRKPGYDPVELFFDPATKGIPLDASLVKGSHGAPARLPEQQGVLLASDAAMLPQKPTLRDTDVAGIVLRQFGLEGVQNQ